MGDHPQNNMPKALHDKLKRQYPNNPKAVYGTMAKMGYKPGSAKNKAASRKGSMAKKRYDTVVANLSKRG